MIQLMNVTKRYENRLVLRGIDLTLSPGEVVGVSGANGTGKSTLLKIMSGRMRQTGGEIRWDDADSCGNLSWIGHEPGVYLDFTARENLSFFCSLAAPVDNPKMPLDDALLAVGLGSVGRKPVRAFSRGMKQRLALARLLVEGRRYWMMDEPTTGLDSESRELLSQHIRSHVAGGGAALVVSHLPEVLSAIADRSAELTKGNLLWGERA